MHINKNIFIIAIIEILNNFSYVECFISHNLIRTKFCITTATRYNLLCESTIWIFYSIIIIAIIIWAYCSASFQVKLDKFTSRFDRFWILPFLTNPEILKKISNAFQQSLYQNSISNLIKLKMKLYFDKHDLIWFS